MAKGPFRAGCTSWELKGSFWERITQSALSPSSQAIYEMSRGEQDLIEDLKLARKVSGIFSCSQ